MSESASDFLKRFIAFFIGPGVSALIGFVAVPLTTWLIAPEEFGKASMFTVLHTLAGLVLYMGLDQAFVREFNVSCDRRKALFLSILPPLLLSVFFTGGLLIFHSEVSFALYGVESFAAVIATAAPIPFMILERFNFLIVRMEERGALYSTMQITRRILDLVLLLTIVFFRRDFLGVISARALTIIFVALFSSAMVRQYWKPVSFFDRELFSKLLRFGLPLVPASILGWVLNAMDKVALRIWADFSEMGIYSSGFRIVSALLVFQAAFTTFWVPTAYRWYETGEPLQKFEKVSDLLSLFLCMTGSFLIIFRKVIILILAPSYSPAAIVVPFLVFFPILYTLSETTVMGIAFTRRTELGIWVSLVSALANFWGNWLLVPILGALGASIATAISYMAFFWMRTFLARAVWRKLSLRPHVVNLGVLVSIAVISAFQDQGYVPGMTAYSICISLVLILLLLNASVLAGVKRALLP
ncbi:MAG: oligosaccharide flippase family protein [Synergistota bacterium]|nr:oligosaccharide flippase family protein [Synergistota bacterium]